VEGGGEGQRAVRVRLVGGRGSVAGGSLGAGGQRMSGGSTSRVPTGMSGVAVCARSRRACRAARSAVELDAQAVPRVLGTEVELHKDPMTMDHGGKAGTELGAWLVGRGSGLEDGAEGGAPRGGLSSSRVQAASGAIVGGPGSVQGRAFRSWRCGVRLSAERWVGAAGRCGRAGSGGAGPPGSVLVSSAGRRIGERRGVLVADLGARRGVRSRVVGRADRGCCR
jgi:hypothetical protein